MFIVYKIRPLRPLSKSTKIGFQDQLSLNAGQKYCKMILGEHPTILSNFIKLPFVIKIFVLSIFEWLLKTGFTVQEAIHVYLNKFEKAFTHLFLVIFGTN